MPDAEVAEEEANAEVVEEIAQARARDEFRICLTYRNSLLHLTHLPLFISRTVILPFGILILGCRGVIVLLVLLKTPSPVLLVAGAMLRVPRGECPQSHERAGWALVLGYEACDYSQLTRSRTAKALLCQAGKRSGGCAAHHLCGKHCRCAIGGALVFKRPRGAMGARDEARKLQSGIAVSAL